MNIPFFELLLKKIKEFEKISIFVHTLPDPDALGSAFALKFWISLNFPKKEISVIGINKIKKNKFNNFFKEFKNTEFNDEQIKNSLGIIVDTANNTRVLSNKNNLCKETIRIDHHPRIENFCDFEWIDETKISTCEMVGLFMKHINLKINTKIIEFLYLGLLTDSNRFLFKNTSKITFDLMSWFSEFHFNKTKIHNLIYINNLTDLKINNKLFKKAKFKNNIGYLVIKNKKIQTSKVYLLENIKEAAIWTSIYYDFENKKWKGSIRSRNIKINHIAEKYNGGGHDFAAGFTINKISEFKQILLLLNKEIDKSNEISST